MVYILVTLYNGITTELILRYLAPYLTTLGRTSTRLRQCPRPVPTGRHGARDVVQSRRVAAVGSALARRSRYCSHARGAERCVEKGRAASSTRREAERAGGVHWRAARLLRVITSVHRGVTDDEAVTQTSH